MGCAFTRLCGPVQEKRRRRDTVALVLDLDVPLLHHLQHEYATRALRPR
jgi:hypothetical protein